VKILYLIPGWMSQTDAGRQELRRRQSFLQQAASPTTQVEVWDVEGGPASIESITEEYLSVPGALAPAQEAARYGVDGIILGCFGDPGVDAARELLTIPVVGPGEASMLLAASLGHRISIVTILESVMHPLRRLAREVGVESKLASIRAINTPVLALGQQREETYQRVLRAAQDARDIDGADVIVLGCMTMAFLGDHRRLAEAVELPVVNPVQAALKLIEAQVAMGLAHSKRAYPLPPKTVPLEANRT
jgi:allantoin racemase